jgi:hypothetical protein
VASLLLVAALATSLPTVDIKTICRSAQAAALPEDRARAFDSCVNEEQAAFDQLKQNWTRYSQGAHENCAEFGGMSLSYVELLTCLKMQSGGDLSANHLPKPSGGDLGLDQPQPPTGAAPKMPKRLMSPSANP